MVFRHRALVAIFLVSGTQSLVPPLRTTGDKGSRFRMSRLAAGETSGETDEDLRKSIEELRKEVSDLEKALDPSIAAAKAAAVREATVVEAAATPPSLEGKTVVVCGANGGVGSQCVRELLRAKGGPAEVRALVRDTDEVESYSRLSYETGAEEGVGSISAPWVSREISFEFSEERQSDYGLEKLTICAGDVLDQSFANEVVKGADCVIFCAAPSPPRPGLKLLGQWGKALQGKAPTGSVSAEGVANMAAALNKEFSRSSEKAGAPNSFVLLSSSRGSDAQRQGEAALKESGLESWVVVQPVKLDDFFSVENATVIVSEEGGDAEGGSLSRDAVAEFLAGVPAADSYRGKTLRIYGGPPLAPPEEGEYN